MSRPHDFLVDSVSGFLVQSAPADTCDVRPIPNSVPHLLSHLLLAVEEYVEGAPESVPLLRRACQRIIMDLATAFRAAQWPQEEAIGLVTKFVDWSMRNTVCQSTDAVIEWITKQAPLWMMAVYTPTPNIPVDSLVGSSQYVLW